MLIYITLSSLNAIYLAMHDLHPSVYHRFSLSLSASFYYHMTGKVSNDNVRPNLREIVIQATLYSFICENELIILSLNDLIDAF